MKLQWLTSALTELDRIYDYIAEENPKAARQVFLRIQSATRQLSRFPETGRPGQMAGTRELIVHGLPYFIVYRVTATHAEIIRVLHTSRDWPPGMQ